MKHLIIVVIFFVLFSFSIQAADSWKEVLEVIQQPCAEFVQRKDGKDFAKKWLKKLDDRIQQRIQDSGDSYENHLRAIFLDWASGREDKLREDDEQSYLELCLFVGVFAKKNIAPPSMVTERLTVELGQRLVEKLCEF